MRSWPSWVREMQGAWTCWSNEVFSRKGAFPPPQFLRKGAQWCVFIDPYLHWGAYRHNETWWSEESAVFFHCLLRLIVRSIGTQGCQGMGKMYGVGEEGEIPKEKKWRAGLQRMNISMDHLALCTPGLTGFSVESWRLKPAHILLETVVSAALRFASKG